MPIFSYVGPRQLHEFHSLKLHQLWGWQIATPEPIDRQRVERADHAQPQAKPYR